MRPLVRTGRDNRPPSRTGPIGRMLVMLLVLLCLPLICTGCLGPGVAVVEEGAGDVETDAPAATGDDAMGEEPPLQRGVFSWNSRLVNGPDERLFEVMDELDIDSLYQAISLERSSVSEVADFLTRARAEGVAVYDLVGDPSWGLDPSGKKLRVAIEEVAELDRAIGEGSEDEEVPHIKGIVFDVEPYSLDEWDEDPEGVLGDLVSGLSSAHELAREHGLEVIVCIPRWYESVSPDLLEDLIADGCDQVAVMNYKREGEVRGIATEAALTASHGKGLINVYEMQPPDEESDVGDENTYWGEGIDAAEENYRSLQAAYPDQNVSVAYHEWSALYELLQGGE